MEYEYVDNYFDYDRYYLKLEREYNEKALLKELNDIEKTIRKNSFRKSNYSRPNTDNRIGFQKGLYIFGEIPSNRKTEKFIITKSNKKRVFKSIRY